MARKGLFFRPAARTHERHRTPHRALTYQCIWACVLVFSGSFELLTDLVIIAAFIFNGLIAYGVIRLRRTLKDAHRPYRVPLYPFVPVVFVLFCVVLLGISIHDSPQKSLIGLLLILSGLPFYFLWRKRALEAADGPAASDG